MGWDVTCDELGDPKKEIHGLIFISDQTILENAVL